PRCGHSHDRARTSVSTVRARSDSRARFGSGSVDCPWSGRGAWRSAQGRQQRRWGRLLLPYAACVSLPRVLVVDDEQQIRRSLRVTLRTNGYDVDEAATGEAALDSVAVSPPELIILDLGLPDVDGV